MRKFWALLVFICCASHALAMGGPTPKKEEPEYKLEILKMELVTAPAQSLEEPTEEGKSKYKLEILKMDVITAPSPSLETK